MGRCGSACEQHGNRNVFDYLRQANIFFPDGHVEASGHDKLEVYAPAGYYDENLDHQYY